MVRATPASFYPTDEATVLSVRATGDLPEKKITAAVHQASGREAISRRTYLDPAYAPQHR